MKKILAFDIEKCTGCRICELVCALEKGEGCNPARARIRIVKSDESGIDVPGICQHCEEPPCQDVCPVEAIVRDPETQAVILRSDVCIGCRACTLVCPYGAITMDPERGVMVKCDLCGGNPRCVEFCPKDALVYERADVLEAKRRDSKHQGIIGRTISMEEAGC
jgi:Fe-S-cluster-containing hydrogenase component 2